MPKATSTATAHFSKLQRAHVDLMLALSGMPPARIIGEADAADIEARTDLMGQVFRAAWRYAEAIADDTAAHLPRMRVTQREAVVQALFDYTNHDDPSAIIAHLARAGIHFDRQAEAA